MTLKLPTYSLINAKHTFKFLNEAGIKKAYMGFAKLCIYVQIAPRLVLYGKNHACQHMLTSRLTNLPPNASFPWVFWVANLKNASLVVDC